MKGTGPRRRGLCGEMTHVTATVIGGEPVALRYDAALNTGDARMQVVRIIVQHAVSFGDGASLAEVEFEQPPECTHGFEYGLFGLPMLSEGHADRGWLASVTRGASRLCTPWARCMTTSPTWSCTTVTQGPACEAAIQQQRAEGTAKHSSAWARP